MKKRVIRLCMVISLVIDLKFGLTGYRGALALCFGAYHNITRPVRLSMDLILMLQSLTNWKRSLDILVLVNLSTVLCINPPFSLP